MTGKSVSETCQVVRKTLTLGLKSKTIRRSTLPDRPTDGPNGIFRAVVASVPSQPASQPATGPAVCTAPRLNRRRLVVSSSHAAKRRTDVLARKTHQHSRRRPRAIRPPPICPSRENQCRSRTAPSIAIGVFVCLSVRQHSLSQKPPDVQTASNFRRIFLVAAARSFKYPLATL